MATASSKEHMPQSSRHKRLGVWEAKPPVEVSESVAGELESEGLD